MRPNFQLLALAVVFPLVFGIPAKAQTRQKSQSTTQAPSLIRTGTIFVQVLGASGTVLGVNPTVALTQDGFDGPGMSVPEPIGRNQWKFQGLKGGSVYVVKVQAKGYLPQEKYVELANTVNATARINVYLVANGRPEDTFAEPPGHFLLPPRAQREVEQAVKDLKSSKPSKARKHLEKALKIAPRHPTVNYLMGMSYLMDHQTDKALPYLEKSVSIDPTQLPALLALATVRYRQGNYSAVVDLLKDAVVEGSALWQVQWILAAAYLHERKYEQARDHAEASLKANKKKARGVRLILGEALAGLGLRQQAVEQLATFLKENPNDPEDVRVRALAKKLREPVSPSMKSTAVSLPGHKASKLSAKETAAPVDGNAHPGNASSRTPLSAIVPVVPPAPPTAVPPKPSWAPPDVDAMKPRIISNRACPLPSLLRRARRTAVEWVRDLQEFTATEEYQSVEIDHHGNVGRPFEKKFDYLVFIQKPRPHLLAIQELRRPHVILSRMGAPIVAFGGPGLALVFHPNYVNEYRWSCDGIGVWRGKRAWIVRFTQRSDLPPTTLQSFEDDKGSHLLRLKGIAWLSEKGDHVMHLETDLVKPMPSIHLEREHFSLSYRQVAFRSHPVKLWLPESVDFYVTFRGHSYHNYSHYSHFLLFWAGVGQTMEGAIHAPPH